MNTMGYRNSKALYTLSRQGKLNTVRGGNASFNPMAMAMMQYMATMTADWDPDRHYRLDDVPPRCYWGGWPAMVEDFGMVMPTQEQALDDTVDKENLFSNRQKVSVNRLSSTAQWLEQQGLVKQLVSANTRRGRHAIWLLLLGDDFENEQVEAAARIALGLPAGA